MQEVIETLPDHPITIEQVFGLMEPPRTVGFVNPAFITEDGCVGFYCEHEGEMKAAGYTNEGWSRIGTIHESVDDVLHDRGIADVFTEVMFKDLEQKRDGDFDSVEPEAQFEAPIGYQFKLCVRHQGLTPEDYEAINTYPQFADVEAIWGNPDDGVVGLAAAEREAEPPDVGGVVFAYFNPELDTWRIVDIAGSMSGSDVADQIHGETKDQLEDYYDTVEMIVGPQ